MKVYRYLTERELNCIKSGNTQDIGSFFDREKFKKVNNHRYKENVRYLHFFKTTKMIHLIRNLHRHDNQKYYICEFNIPLKNLLCHFGFGFYEASGYDLDNYRVLEFAIESSKLNPNWLVKYELDTKKDSIFGLSKE